MLVEIDIDQTRRAFDIAAPVYDSAYEGLYGIKRIRSITRNLYLHYFPAGGKLLELNCGTGNDAITLARHGMNILATDISPRMLVEVEKKVDLEGLSHSLKTRLISFQRLGELHSESFAGAYSNLGGLNCVDDLRPVAENLAAVIRPGGYFIATVMPPVCLWETAAYLARFKWRPAFRRMRRNGTNAALYGRSFLTFYHSPATFRAACAPWFDHVKTLGLILFLPPPNFSRTYTLLGKAVRLLELLDDTLAGITPFASLGDHYAIVLRRKSN